MSFIKIMILIYQIEWIENEWWFFSWMIVTCIPCIHDMIFMQFFIFMKYLSHHPIISFSIFLKWWYECMRYSWIYFDVCKWEVSIMHGRMQCDKLIPWWFEIFMIWNDAYAFYYDNVWCVSWMLKKKKIK